MPRNIRWHLDEEDGEVVLGSWGKTCPVVRGIRWHLDLDEENQVAPG